MDTTREYVDYTKDVITIQTSVCPIGDGQFIDGKYQRVEDAVELCPDRGIWQVLRTSYERRLR